MVGFLTTILPIHNASGPDDFRICSRNLQLVSLYPFPILPALFLSYTCSLLRGLPASCQNVVNHPLRNAVVTNLVPLVETPILKKFAFILCTLTLALAVRAAAAEHETPGDAEFRRMDYHRARAIYDSVLATSPDSAVVLWKIARAYICEADVLPKDDKRPLYYAAQDFAKRSVAADSNSSLGHAWLAAAIGNVAMYEGGKTKISLVYVIKNQLDRAIALDSTNDLAWSILGSYYKALGDISWFERQIANLIYGKVPDGGYDESVVAFKRAIALDPNMIRHHYELGKVYARQDRKADALTEFQISLSLPVYVAVDSVMLKDVPKLMHELED